jgi:hypothetical protein
MRKKAAIAILIAAVTSPAQADWKESVRDGFLFAAGITTSFVVHEAGHALTARSYGEKLDWHGSGFNSHWSCRYPCRNIEQVAVAGNLSTAIVGESLLYIPAEYRHSPFVDGMQMFNTINPITYTYEDSTTSGGYRDYRNVDDRIQIALAIHAASIGYRQFSDRLWNVAVVPRGIKFNIQF